MKKSLVLIAIIVVVIGLVWLSAKTQKFGGVDQIAIGTTSTNSSSTVGVVAVKILSDKTDAQARWCTNMGAATLYLSFNATSTGFVPLTGYSLGASTTLSMSGSNLWPGNIWALTATGTSTVSCTQL